MAGKLEELIIDRLSIVERVELIEQI